MEQLCWAVRASLPMQPAESQLAIAAKLYRQSDEGTWIDAR